MKRNYLEDDLQIQVAQYLDLKRVFWFHPANERKTTPQAGARLKAKGVKAGVPDCMIMLPRGDYNGLAIELKHGKNKPTEHQEAVLNNLQSCGWKTAVCYSFDDAKEIIDNYLRLNNGNNR